MRNVLLMAAVAVLAATLLLNFSSAHAKQDTTFVTIADARSGIATPVDLGAPGDSPGDMFVFDQPLLNEARQPIGSNSGYCIRTLPGQFSECQWTLTMANGTITVAGREAETGTSLIPIIGGTGAYVGARGVLTTTPNGDRTFTQVLTLFR
ncbi:dirigent protein [Pyxidicoccus parkwayensis]|nr:dirigent protein [Pyxidicoccus parkwaysis]